jgi:hypothetical protein
MDAGGVMPPTGDRDDDEQDARAGHVRASMQVRDDRPDASGSPAAVTLFTVASRGR